MNGQKIKKGLIILLIAYNVFMLASYLIRTHVGPDLKDTCYPLLREFCAYVNENPITSEELIPGGGFAHREQEKEYDGETLTIQLLLQRRLAGKDAEPEGKWAEGDEVFEYILSIESESGTLVYWYVPFVFDTHGKLKETSIESTAWDSGMGRGSRQLATSNAVTSSLTGEASMIVLSRKGFTAATDGYEVRFLLSVEDGNKNPVMSFSEVEYQKWQ